MSQIKAGPQIIFCNFPCKPGKIALRLIFQKQGRGRVAGRHPKLPEQADSFSGPGFQKPARRRMQNRTPDIEEFAFLHQPPANGKTFPYKRRAWRRFHAERQIQRQVHMPGTGQIRKFQGQIFRAVIKAGGGLKKTKPYFRLIQNTGRQPPKLADRLPFPANKTRIL